MPAPSTSTDMMEDDCPVTVTPRSVVRYATPREVIAQLNTALQKVLATPAVRDRFAALGAEVQPSSSEELGKFIRDDLALWVKVVKQAGIKVE